MTTTENATPRSTVDPARFPDFDGRLVRRARVQLGLSAPQLLERIRASGFSLALSGLTRVERGGRTTAKTARAIADALGKPMSAFAGRATAEDAAGEAVDGKGA